MESVIQTLPPLVVVALVLAAAAVQVLLAVGAAVKRKEFDWQRLPDYMESRVIRFGLALAGLALLATAAPDNAVLTGPLFYGSAVVVIDYLRRKAWNDVLFLLGLHLQVSVPDLPPPPVPPAGP